MTEELVRPQESNPIIKPPPVNSLSKGKNTIAQVLGQIADRSFKEATSYASEASNANLLQTHSMLQDIDSKSKLEMARSPEHAEGIAKNAKDAIDQLKSKASLNREDRAKLDNFAHTATNQLTLSAGEKSISLARETSKSNFLWSTTDTTHSIQHSLLADPEKADALVQSYYSAIKGQVSAGIITAVEAENLHKQMIKQLEVTGKLVEGIKSGILTASDASTLHAMTTSQTPLSNAHLPINHVTAMNANHYFGTQTKNDIESRMSNGEHPNVEDLINLKPAELDHILNYGSGAARATGDLNSAESWTRLKSELKILSNKQKLSSYETGYKNRLNNFFNNAKQPGFYENYIISTPEGARLYNSYTENQAVINESVHFGDKKTVARIKYDQSQDNLDKLISKSNALGIGMHWPDNLRQPIPLQYLQPVQDGFNKDGNISAAIQSIGQIREKNRPYFMNSFQDNPRKAATVYEIGNLIGKVSPEYLSNLLESQQVDALGKKGNQEDRQEKFLQLDTSKDGTSNQKLNDKIRSSFGELDAYWRYQPNGASVVNGQIDKASRYIKLVAAKHGDYGIKNYDEYMATYLENTKLATGVVSGFNFTLDTYSVPLETSQMQILASHGINDVRNKMREYLSEDQIDKQFLASPPIMVSSPGGRLTVVNSSGQAYPDQYGHAAYSEMYTEDTWRLAEHDLNAKQSRENTYTTLYGKIQIREDQTPLGKFRAQPEVIRPIIEGNINLEDRPKIYNKKGEFSTIKSITIEEDGKTILLPTIYNGKEHTNKESIDHYHKSGEHLGIFKTREEADKYDEQLHERHGWKGKNNRWDQEKEKQFLKEKLRSEKLAKASVPTLNFKERNT